MPDTNDERFVAKSQEAHEHQIIVGFDFLKLKQHHE
jgi:hypothetical protein